MPAHTGTATQQQQQARAQHTNPNLCPLQDPCPPAQPTFKRSTSAVCLRRMSSTCCKNRLEACCSAESAPPPPPPMAAAAAKPAGVGAAAAAAVRGALAAGAALAATALPPRLRLSSAPRLSRRAAPMVPGTRGVSAGPSAVGASWLEAAAVVGGTPLPPTAAIRPARGVARGSPAAGVTRRLRTESSRPVAERDSAVCCSTLRSVTLRSYFSHCSGDGGRETNEVCPPVPTARVQAAAGAVSSRGPVAPGRPAPRTASRHSVRRSLRGCPRACATSAVSAPRR